MRKRDLEKYTVLAVCMLMMVALAVAVKKEQVKNRDAYAETLIVTEAVHTEGFKGYMICERYLDYEIRMKNENETITTHMYRIQEDPEDIESGDILSAIMDGKGTETIKDDKVIKWKYSGAYIGKEN